MTKAEATAEGFLNVLKALPEKERDAVVVRIARDDDFGRDILDLATIADRRDEPSRPFREYLSEKRGNECVRRLHKTLCRKGNGRSTGRGL